MSTGWEAGHRRPGARTDLRDFHRLQGDGQEEAKPAGPGRVIYVYRNANDESKLEVRELLPAKIKAQFGEVSLQDLLDPERSKLIFSEVKDSRAHEPHALPCQCKSSLSEVHTFLIRDSVI